MPTAYPPSRPTNRRLVSRARRDRAREGGTESEATLDELRRLLMAPEQARIAKVEERLSPDGLGRVLPEAATASQKKSDELAVALSPTMASAVRNAVENDPQVFVEALVPVMGPAIRKSVSTALRALVQQLNETLAHGLSLRSLRWRWEAARTGRPFAEVVLLRSLIYRVEQVFLVHAESGLVLRHVVAPGSPQQDPDQVAAMLTAIDAFVHDAFSKDAEKDAEDARLGRFQVGDLTCWVEHGPLAVLSAVVRGTAPDSYAEVLRRVQEEVHLQFRQPLVTFRGDTEVFAAADPLLESCFRTESAPVRAPLPRSYTRAIVVGLLVLVAALVGASVHRKHVEQARFASFVDRLEHEPGFVVTRAQNDGGRYAIEGLHDPLATTPEDVLARSGIPPKGATLRFEPFYSLDPRLAEKRAVHVLRPPPTVRLSLSDDGVLTAEGTAPQTWIDGARLLAPAVPGVTRFETSGLGEEEARAALERSRARIGATPLFFDLGSADLTVDARRALDGAADAVRAALTQSRNANEIATIEVVGHADTSGTEVRNARLSSDRADRIATELSARGVPSEALVARGEGSVFVPDDTTCANGRRGAECARRVDLRLGTKPAGGPGR